MKKISIIFASFLIIIFCASLIAGATYALFTSTAEVNIAVTSGTVNVTATPSISSVYSIVEDDNGIIIVGEDHYSHQQQTIDNQGVGHFKTTGTASIDADGKIILNNMVPGDKVTVAIAVSNGSNVSIKYRLRFYAENEADKLLEALKITFSSTNIQSVSYNKLLSYTSDGYLVTPDVQNIDTIYVTVEIPAIIGDEYQNKTANLVVLVEAVQGNAKMPSGSATTKTS